MAIISEQAYIADGTQREFQVVGTILSDSHIGVWIVDYSTTPVTETRLPTAHYDVLGSTVLLDVPPQAGLTVSLVLTDNGEGIEIPPSEITDISANINKIINVSDNIEYIITNSYNMQSIIDTASIKDEVVDVADIKTQVVSVANYKITLDSIFNDKAKLDSIFADKATLDSIFADKLTLDTLYSMKEKLDSLYADKNTLDSLYTDKTELDTIYANINAILSIHQNIDNVNYFADRYLGDRDIKPTTRLDGSPLLEGDLYFDKTIKLMRVYSNDGWKVAYSSTDSYTKAEIENLFVGVSGDQTVYDVKTFNLPIVGSITGNSDTATKLETARTINGVAFDGSTNITVSDATAVKLTGNQTIADVKTFSSSPIVPTPSAENEVANKSYVDSISSNIQSLPIGAILSGYTIFDNCIVAFGGEFNRADYPKLWAYLQANPTLVKTQAQWQTEATANGGICGFFSDGNGTTTFRVPNLDKAFLRPDSRGVGSYQKDELKAHSHNINSSNGPNTTLTAYANSAGGNTIPTTKTFETGGIETRPKNIALLPLIVAK